MISKTLAIIIIVLGCAAAKRCPRSQRPKPGYSCGTSCNRRTGRWIKNSCEQQCFIVSFGPFTQAEHCANWPGCSPNGPDNTECDASGSGNTEYCKVNREFVPAGARCVEDGCSPSYGRWLSGTNIGKSTENEEQDCEDKCRSNSVCGGYYYSITDRVCALYGSNVRTHSFVKDHVAGIKDNDDFIIESGKDVAGGEFLSSPGASSQSSCQRRCGDNRRCAGFTWAKGQCFHWKVGNSRQGELAFQDPFGLASNIFSECRY